MSKLNESEKQHSRLLQLMRGCLSDHAIISNDACQIAYTGTFAMPSRAPRSWFFPAGYCALGNALPNAIGAKMAKPDHDVVTVVGDGGFMFTMPELMVAAEHNMPLPVIVWDNGGYKQIRDDMDDRNIPRIGVEGMRPDFELLAKACHCDFIAPKDADSFTTGLTHALAASRPTLIHICENDDWLCE
jgi:thiamine pyrophosphate-dependent acetolactate synthase large subunit-like protein